MAEPGGIPRITDFNQYLQMSQGGAAPQRQPAHPALEARREQITGQPAASSQPPAKPIQTSIAAPGPQRPTEAESDRLFIQEQLRRGVPALQIAETLRTKGSVGDVPFYADPIEYALGGVYGAGRSLLSNLSKNVSGSLLGNVARDAAGQAIDWGTAGLAAPAAAVARGLGRWGLRRADEALTPEVGGAVRSGFNAAGQAMAQPPGKATLLNQAIERARQGAAAAPPPKVPSTPSAAPPQGSFDFAAQPFQARPQSIGGVRPPEAGPMPGFAGRNVAQRDLPLGRPTVGKASYEGPPIRPTPFQPQRPNPAATGAVPKTKTPTGKPLETSIKAPPKAQPQPQQTAAPAPQPQAAPQPMAQPAPQAAAPRPDVTQMDEFIQNNWQRMPMPMQQEFMTKAQQFKQAAAAGDEATTSLLRSDIYDMVMRSIAGVQ